MSQCNKEILVSCTLLVLKCFNFYQRALLLLILYTTTISYYDFCYRVVQKAISSVIGQRLFGEDESSAGSASFLHRCLL